MVGQKKITGRSGEWHSHRATEFAFRRHEQYLHLGTYSDWQSNDAYRWTEQFLYMSACSGHEQAQSGFKNHESQRYTKWVIERLDVSRVGCSYSAMPLVVSATVLCPYETSVFSGPTATGHRLPKFLSSYSFPPSSMTNQRSPIIYTANNNRDARLNGICDIPISE